MIEKFWKNLKLTWANRKLKGLQPSNNYVEKHYLKVVKEDLTTECVREIIKPYREREITIRLPDNITPKETIGIAARVDKKIKKINWLNLLKLKMPSVEYEFELKMIQEQQDVGTLKCYTEDRFNVNNNDGINVRYIFSYTKIRVCKNGESDD